MASINMLISELAHSIQQADSVPVRRALRLSVIHARNDIIRKSYNNHSITDSSLRRTIPVTIGTDGKSDTLPNRPLRLPDGLPFHSVRYNNGISDIELPFVKRAAWKYYANLPGMSNTYVYDYRDNIIYTNFNFTVNMDVYVESVFEQPISDDNETFFPEDIIDAIKKLVLETFNPQVVRQTNEIPVQTLMK
jgi:hypothetical protein